MQSENRAAIAPRRLPQPAPGSNTPPLGGSQSQDPPTVNPATTGDGLTNPIVQSSDEDDVDAEAWTQIPGPSDGEMSDSDDSMTDVLVDYHIPRTIEYAERNTQQSVPCVHRRYKGFALSLCKETATEDAGQYVLEGLPIAIVTAKSIRLDDTADDDRNLYAFALVIHVWQIVCIRMQHGKFPPEGMGESLCFDWAAYFLSAHTIAGEHLQVSREELRFAVRYWEDRLRLMGGGNRWMQDQWAKDITRVDLDTVMHRNKTADRYLNALERHGKEGLTISIIDEEKKGDGTNLRIMTQQSPDGMKNARRQIASLLYSMDTSLLRAIIQGQLPRLAEIESGTVYQAVRKLHQTKYIQPGTYMNCICDGAGLSPTPAQWGRVCEGMLKYVQYGNEHNDLAEQIDQRLHPKTEWPTDLAHRGLRRYTEWRSYTEKGSGLPDTVHRRMVRYFVDQLKRRMKGQPTNAPLNVPVVEIGFSNDPRKRLRQHRHHESSNYLMNLAEAVFAMKYSGSFRLQQTIVFACYRSIQTWLSEIVITQLAQGYVDEGAGFSHEPAGRSNTSSNNKIPAKMWAFFEEQVYADGTFEKEVDANSHRLQTRKRTRELREQEREAAKTLRSGLVAHLGKLSALEEVRVRLYDHLRK